MVIWWKLLYRKNPVEQYMNTWGKIKILVISVDNVFADHAFWRSRGNSWFHRLFVFVAPKCPSEATREHLFDESTLGCSAYFQILVQTTTHACTALSVCLCVCVSLSENLRTKFEESYMGTHAQHTHITLQHSTTARHWPPQLTTLTCTHALLYFMPKLHDAILLCRHIYMYWQWAWDRPDYDSTALTSATDWLNPYLLPQTMTWHLPLPQTMTQPLPLIQWPNNMALYLTSTRLWLRLYLYHRLWL